VSHVDAQALLEVLRSAGMRVTAPRRAVCEVLAVSHDEHLNAVELHRLAEERAGRPIDQSTIYRTIEALESAGLLHHVHLGHGPSVIHLTDRTDHHHLVCEVCGRTVDLDLDEFAEVTARIQEEHGFIADSVHFALVGRCVEHGDAVHG
jgi:Fur family ferric uptake transcriptional regulator